MTTEATNPAAGGAVNTPGSDAALPPLETGAPPATSEPKTTQDTSTETQQQTDSGKPEAEKTGEEDKERKPNRISAEERIKQAVRRQRMAERERDRALGRVAELEKPIRPQNYDQLDFEQRDHLRVREAVRQETAESTRLEAERAETDRREAWAEARAARNEAFAEKLSTAEAQNPGLFERFAAVPVTEEMAAFIADSDVSVEIANYLSMPANRREVEHLHRLTDPRGRPSMEDLREADRMMSRIETRLSKAPQTRKATTAPNPGTTLNGQAPPANLSLTDLVAKDDMAAYAARRKEAWKKGQP